MTTPGHGCQIPTQSHDPGSLTEPFRSLLSDLRPLLLFQKAFAEQNGRCAYDGELPEDLLHLTGLYREHSASLAKKNGLIERGEVFDSPGAPAFHHKRTASQAGHLHCSSSHHSVNSSKVSSPRIYTRQRKVPDKQFARADNDALHGMHMSTVLHSQKAAAMLPEPCSEGNLESSLPGERSFAENIDNTKVSVFGASPLQRHALTVIDSGRSNNLGDADATKNQPTFEAIPAMLDSPCLSPALRVRPGLARFGFERPPGLGDLSARTTIRAEELHCSTQTTSAKLIHTKEGIQSGSGFSELHAAPGDAEIAGNSNLPHGLSMQFTNSRGLLKLSRSSKEAFQHPETDIADVLLGAQACLGRPVNTIFAGVAKGCANGAARTCRNSVTLTGSVADGIEQQQPSFPSSRAIPTISSCAIYATKSPNLMRQKLQPSSPGGNDTASGATTGSRKRALNPDCMDTCGGLMQYRHSTSGNLHQTRSSGPSEAALLHSGNRRRATQEPDTRYTGLAGFSLCGIPDAIDLEVAESSSSEADNVDIEHTASCVNDKQIDHATCVREQATNFLPHSTMCMSKCKLRVSPKATSSKRRLVGTKAAAKPHKTTDKTSCAQQCHRVQVQRVNFVRYQNGVKRKHSFGFRSKSAMAGTIKSATGRRIRHVRGKLAVAPLSVRGIAGTGSDFVESFKAEKRCFCCNSTGHFARECPHKDGTHTDVQTQSAACDSPGAPDGDALMIHDMVDSEKARLPMIYEQFCPTSPTAVQPFQIEALLGGHLPTCSDRHALEPSSFPSKDSKLPLDTAQYTDEQLTKVLQEVFGYQCFRDHQANVIRRVLSGESVLAILPTGAGKSICYQLPALLLPGLVLVVSPLLALMRDQLDQLPTGLPGAMLWGGQTRSEANKIIFDCARGHVRLLYIAPEKLLVPAVLQTLLELPHGIGLVCVDEAHCVAEWGHSFRPAYYRLGHVLRAVLRPRSVLALTATATRATERCIAEVLGIPSEAVIRDAPLRDNLRLKVLHHNGATGNGKALRSIAQLLKDGDLKHVHSVVVYCAFQAQSDQAAAILKQSGIRAASYHAGKSMEERLAVQRDFSGQHLRVVVATVAFGMGINISSLGAVIHLAMPRSLEDYVQQVGRAGRDGSEVGCWVLLDDADHQRLRSLCCSNAVDLSSVELLLHTVFAPPEWEAAHVVMPNSTEKVPDTQSLRIRYGVLPITEATIDMDITEETIETVLSYLQGHDGSGMVSVLPSTAAMLSITFYTDPSVLAQHSSLVLSLLTCRPHVQRGVYKVPMARIVHFSGHSPSHILGELAGLAASQSLRWEASKARALAWRIINPPSKEELPALSKQICERLKLQQSMNVCRMDTVYSVMSVAARTGTDAVQQEMQLRRHIQEYFASNEDIPQLCDITELPVIASERASVEVAAFLHCCKSQVLGLKSRMSGVAVARILHGLASAAYPADQWRRCGAELLRTQDTTLAHPE